MKAKRTARPLTLWSVIVHNPRTSWIYWPSISRTRKQAFKQYGESYTDPNYARKHLKEGRISLQRVTVAPQPQKSAEKEVI